MIMVIAINSLVDILSAIAEHVCFIEFRSSILPITRWPIVVVGVRGNIVRDY
jgi:hypothetical protein